MKNRMFMQILETEAELNEEAPDSLFGKVFPLSFSLFAEL
jgi:hypothetical protein